MPVFPVSQQRMPVFPAPMSPFTIVLLHEHISVCVGCHQRFPRKPNGEYADPPYTMAIQHMEQRTYNSPITGIPTSKIGNAYYHAFLPCLQSNWPAVSASDIVIPSEVVLKLHSEHKLFLFHNCGITV